MLSDCGTGIVVGPVITAPGITEPVPTELTVMTTAFATIFAVLASV